MKHFLYIFILTVISACEFSKGEQHDHVIIKKMNVEGEIIQNNSGLIKSTYRYTVRYMKDSIYYEATFFEDELTFPTK